MSSPILNPSTGPGVQANPGTLPPARPGNVAYFANLSCMFFDNEELHMITTASMDYMASKNPKASWNKTSVTSFGYKNYGIRSERYRYIVYADGTEELYDHEKDKWEWRNLADNPEYAKVKKDMRKGIPAHHEPSGITYKLPARKRNTR